MLVPIKFCAPNEDGIDVEVARYESENVPRLGELVILREDEEGEDIFSDYKVVEVVHRLFVDKDGSAEIEFYVVTLRPLEDEAEAVEQPTTLTP